MVPAEFKVYFNFYYFQSHHYTYWKSQLLLICAEKNKTKHKPDMCASVFLLKNDVSDAEIRQDPSWALQS